MDTASRPPLCVIARVRDDFKYKFGLPRQSGLVSELAGTIVFEPQYRRADALRGIEGYSHLWIIWGFSEGEREGWSPTVRPPRLGGNARMGVFATRSPNRPNAIGLSCVKLDSVEYDAPNGPVLHISGLDMLDNTPVYDIKPYLPYVDCRADAIGGFTDEKKDYRLDVVFPDELLKAVPKDRQKALLGVLSNDPRPAYQNDPERIYGLDIGDINVKFTVEENVLTVRAIART